MVQKKKEKISKKIKKIILNTEKIKFVQSPRFRSRVSKFNFRGAQELQNKFQSVFGVLDSIKEKALTSVVASKQIEPLKLEALKIKPKKLEERIEKTIAEENSPVPVSSSSAIVPSLKSSPQPQITETAERNYSSIPRKRRYAAQRAERAETAQATAPRTAEAERAPYSTIVLYSNAQQQTIEKARVYTPGENTMHKAMQMANRLANKVPQPEIEQNEIFENKMPSRVPQNASEKVNYDLVKSQEQKPKRRYPWEG